MFSGNGFIFGMKNLIGGFWDVIDNLISFLWTFVGDVLVSVIVLIMRFILNIVDLLQLTVKKLAGLDYWGQGKASLDTLGDSDIIFRFLFSEPVQRAFRYMIVIFVVLVIILTVVAIVKNEYTLASGSDSKKNTRAILLSSLRTALMVLLIPILLIGGIISSNAILTSITNALDINNNLTMGSQLFTVSGYSSNRYRLYADNNQRYPASTKVNVTYEYEEDTYTSLIETGMNLIVPKDYDDGDHTFKGYHIKLDGEDYLFEVTNDEESLAEFDENDKTKAYEMKKAAYYKYLHDILKADVVGDSDGFINQILNDKTSGNDLIKAAYNTWYYNDELLSSRAYDETIAKIKVGSVTLFNNTINNYYLVTNSVAWGVNHDGGTWHNGSLVSIANLASLPTSYKSTYAPLRDEYYVMADVVDFMAEEGVSLYHVNINDARINWTFYGDKLDGTVNLGKYLGSTLGSTDDKINEPDIFAVKYSNEGNIVYLADRSRYDELEGAIFIMCYYDAQSDRYVPLLNNQPYTDDMGTTRIFSSEYYTSDYDGVVIARGVLENKLSNSIGYPSIISSVYTNSSTDVAGERNKAYYKLTNDAQVGVSTFVKVRDYGITLEDTHFITNGDQKKLMSYNGITGKAFEDPTKSYTLSDSEKRSRIASSLPQAFNLNIITGSTVTIPVEGGPTYSTTTTIGTVETVEYEVFRYGTSNVYAYVEKAALDDGVLKFFMVYENGTTTVDAPIVSDVADFNSLIGGTVPSGKTMAYITDVDYNNQHGTGTAVVSRMYIDDTSGNLYSYVDGTMQTVETDFLFEGIDENSKTRGYTASVGYYTVSPNMAELVKNVYSKKDGAWYFCNGAYLNNFEASKEGTGDGGYYYQFILDNSTTTHRDLFIFENSDTGTVNYATFRLYFDGNNNLTSVEAYDVFKYSFEYATNLPSENATNEIFTFLDFEEVGNGSGTFRTVYDNLSLYGNFEKNKVGDGRKNENNYTPQGTYKMVLFSIQSYDPLAFRVKNTSGDYDLFMYEPELKVVYNNSVVYKLDCETSVPYSDLDEDAQEALKDSFNPVEQKYFFVSQNQIVTNKIVYNKTITNGTKHDDYYTVEYFIYSGKGGQNDDNSYVTRAYSEIVVEREDSSEQKFPDVTPEIVAELINNNYKFILSGGKGYNAVPRYDSADQAESVLGHFSQKIYFTYTEKSTDFLVVDVNIIHLLSGKFRWFHVRFFRTDCPTREVAMILDNGKIAINYNMPIEFGSSKTSGAFNDYYVPHKFNFIVYVFAAIIVLNVLFTSVWGLIQRIYEITIYFLVMPGVAAAAPLDGNNMFNNWKKQLVPKVLGAYGVVIGLNLFFLLIPPIKAASQIFVSSDFDFMYLDWIPGIYKAKYLNLLIYIMFLLVAISMIKTLPGLVSSLIGASDVYSEGQKTRDNVKKVTKEVQDGVSGKTVVDKFHEYVGERDEKTGKWKNKFLSSFVPGSAIASAIRESSGKKQDAADKEFEEQRKAHQQALAAARAEDAGKKMATGFTPMSIGDGTEPTGSAPDSPTGPSDSPGTGGGGAEAVVTSETPTSAAYSAASPSVMVEALRDAVSSTYGTDSVLLPSDASVGAPATAIEVDLDKVDGLVNEYMDLEIAKLKDPKDAEKSEARQREIAQSFGLDPDDKGTFRKISEVFTSIDTQNTAERNLILAQADYDTLGDAESRAKRDIAKAWVNRETSWANADRIAMLSGTFYQMQILEMLDKIDELEDSDDFDTNEKKQALAAQLRNDLSQNDAKLKAWKINPELVAPASTITSRSPEAFMGAFGIGERRDAEAELEASRTTFDKKQQALQTAQAELESVDAEFAEKQKAYEAKEREIDELPETDRIEATRELSNMKAELVALESKKTSLQSGVDSADAELKRARQELILNEIAKQTGSMTASERAQKEQERAVLAKMGDAAGVEKLTKEIEDDVATKQQYIQMLAKVGDDKGAMTELFRRIGGPGSEAGEAGTAGKAGKAGEAGVAGKAGEAETAKETGVAERAKGEGSSEEAKYWADMSREQAEIARDWADIASGNIKQYSKAELGLGKKTRAEKKLDAMMLEREKSIQAQEQGEGERTENKTEAYNQYNKAHGGAVILDRDDKMTMEEAKAIFNANDNKDGKNKFVEAKLAEIQGSRIKNENFILTAINQYNASHSSKIGASSIQNYMKGGNNNTINNVLSEYLSKTFDAESTMMDKDEVGYLDAAIAHHNLNARDSKVITDSSKLTQTQILDLQAEYAEHQKALGNAAFKQLEEKTAIDRWNSAHADKQITDGMDRNERNALIADARQEFQEEQAAMRIDAENDYVNTKSDEAIEKQAEKAQKSRERADKLGEFADKFKGKGLVGKTTTLLGLGIKAGVVGTGKLAAGGLKLLRRQPSEAWIAKQLSKNEAAKDKQAFLAGERERIGAISGTAAEKLKTISSEFTDSEMRAFVEKYNKKNQGKTTWLASSDDEKFAALQAAKLAELKRSEDKAAKEIDITQKRLGYKRLGMLPRVHGIVKSGVKKFTKSDRFESEEKSEKPQRAHKIRNAVKGAAAAAGQGVASKANQIKEKAQEHGVKKAGTKARKASDKLKAAQEAMPEDYTRYTDQKAFAKAEKKVKNLERKLSDKEAKLEGKISKLSSTRSKKAGLTDEERAKETEKVRQAASRKATMERAREKDRVKAREEQVKAQAAASVQEKSAGRRSRTADAENAGRFAKQIKEEDRHAAAQGHLTKAVQDEYKRQLSQLLKSDKMKRQGVTVGVDLEKATMRQVQAETERIRKQLTAEYEKKAQTAEAKAIRARLSEIARLEKQLEKAAVQRKIDGGKTTIKQDHTVAVPTTKAERGVKASASVYTGLSAQQKADIGRVAREYLREAQVHMRNGGGKYASIRLTDPKMAYNQMNEMMKTMQKDIRNLMAKASNADNVAKIKRLQKAIDEIKNTNRRMRYQIKGINSNVSPVGAMQQAQQPEGETSHFKRSDDAFRR